MTIDIDAQIASLQTQLDIARAKAVQLRDQYHLTQALVDNLENSLAGLQKYAFNATENESVISRLVTANIIQTGDFVGV